MRDILRTRPSCMPKYVPSAGDGCVLWLPGQDDPKSTLLRDRSGTGSNSSLTGATWAREGSGLWVQAYDGIDDFASITDSLIVRPAAITLALWVQGRELGSQQVLMSRFNALVQAAGYQMEIAASQKGRFGLRTVNDSQEITSTTSVVINKYVHWAGTYDGSVLNIYRNGIVDATPVAVVGGAIAYEAGTDLEFGRNPTNPAGTYLNGRLGLYRLYNRALTATEVSGIVQSERYLFGV